MSECDNSRPGLGSVIVGERPAINLESNGPIDESPRYEAALDEMSQVSGRQRRRETVTAPYHTHIHARLEEEGASEKSIPIVMRGKGASSPGQKPLVTRVRDEREGARSPVGGEKPLVMRDKQGREAQGAMAPSHTNPVSTSTCARAPVSARKRAA